MDEFVKLGFSVPNIIQNKKGTVIVYLPSTKYPDSYTVTVKFLGEDIKKYGTELTFYDITKEEALDIAKKSA